MDAIEVSESSDGHGRSVNLFGAQKVVLLSVYLPASVGEVIRVRGPQRLMLFKRVLEGAVPRMRDGRRRRRRTSLQPSLDGYLCQKAGRGLPNRPRLV